MNLVSPTNDISVDDAVLVCATVSAVFEHQASMGLKVEF